ncbi:MAG: glutamate--tRNA ligase [Candidatus Moraniibacteriota bacterium]|nr:MAG: glutamate--tRNA ligase [Candidatus Moranbacteria bacterium]
MDDKKVRVRFAPSPTGYLHVGSLRTALYNYLFARKCGGTFILRIEDTDRKRLVEDAVEKLLGTLGLFFDWDEGLVGKAENGRWGTTEKGMCGPYVQSARLDIYRKHAEELIDKGRAYRCFCSAERLEAVRKEQEARKEPTRYDGRCRNLSKEEVSKKLIEDASYVVRLRVDGGDGNITFDDAVRGKVSFLRETIDDQVLLKSDGFPTYHLANVVDDHLMGITHVIRGEEWLPSTPKHILLYEAFGWNIPQFSHLPLLLNPDRSKLSKRQGDVAVEDYLAKGYLPEALLNFVALLGWNPGEGKTQEIFSLRELVDEFDLAHVHKGGAVFDGKKLDWLNAQYIKNLSAEELFTRALPFLRQKTWFESVEDSRKESEYVARVLVIEQDRLQKLSDVGESSKFLFVEPTVDPLFLPWKKNTPKETRLLLETMLAVLADIPDNEWERGRLEKTLLETAGERRGDFLWPLRVALSGEKQSPPPHEIAWVIGKQSTLERIEKAETLLEKML